MDGFCCYPKRAGNDVIPDSLRGWLRYLCVVEQNVKIDNDYQDLTHYYFLSLLRCCVHHLHVLKKRESGG